MEIELKNISGQVVGEVQASDTLFGTPFNPSVVHQAMVMYQLNRRQGTHKTKVRSEVSGGGAKPFRQKHTGRARAGSNRSPIWRHGGITFGPRPRSYRRAMPKRMRRLALRCVLSQKLKSSRLVLIEGFDEVGGRTKEMIQVLKSLHVTGSTLIVTGNPEKNVVRSARNIPRTWTLPVNLLNAEDLLKRNNLVLTLGALRRAEDIWGSGADSVTILPIDGAAPVEVEPEEAVEPATETEMSVSNEVAAVAEEADTNISDEVDEVAAEPEMSISDDVEPADTDDDTGAEAEDTIAEDQADSQEKSEREA